MLATGSTVAFGAVHRNWAPRALLISLATLLALGTLTLVLNDPSFIMIRPTIVNAGFAAVLCSEAVCC